MAFRFHVLAIPHTITTPEYSACAFTQKVVKLCKMLRSRGHWVMHYGHADSDVECDEKIRVTDNLDLEASYPGHDWRVHGFPTYRLDDQCYRSFYANTISEIHRRKQARDFLLVTFGGNHRPIVNAHPDMIAVESGIGYPDGGFCRFRIFESYAVLHAYQGVDRIKWANEQFWYDAVIPNAFDLDQFEFNPGPRNDYFLFLGRIGAGKGVHIAIQICEEINMRLVIAGAGALHGSEQRTQRPLSEYISLAGLVGPLKRKVLLSHAKATICASTFLEPQCGVAIESMISGTPVISSDWGAFSEIVIPGGTGYRCRVFAEFIAAAQNISRIDPRVCRKMGERFSLDRIAEEYDRYFHAVAAIYGGAGWYEMGPGIIRAPLA